MIPDSLAPGIVIRAPDKTSERESGDEATTVHRGQLHLQLSASGTTCLLLHF